MICSELVSDTASCWPEVRSIVMTSRRSYGPVISAYTGHLSFQGSSHPWNRLESLRPLWVCSGYCILYQIQWMYRLYRLLQNDVIRIEYGFGVNVQVRILYSGEDR